MSQFSLNLLRSVSALFLGTGLTSAHALNETDFINTGSVISSPTQYENNEANNSSEVLVQPKGLTITKVADTSGMSTPTKVGDIINYTISLDNIGLLDLTGVTLSETIIPAANLTLTSGDINNDAILNADEIWRYGGSYAVTQEDIDTHGSGDGDIDNTVTVTTNELSPLSDSVEVPITQAPEFIVVKTVDKASIAEPDTLGYEVKVTNTGNVTLNNVQSVNVLPSGGLDVLVSPTGDAGIPDALDVGETWTYSTSYNATQFDIDTATDLVNSVEFTSDETGAITVGDIATTSVSVEPLMFVVKTVDKAVLNTPNTVSYTIAVSNDGNISLSNVAPVDTLPDGTTATLTGPLSDVGLAGQLDVGEMWEYTTQYAVSQAEFDVGLALVNTVAVTSDQTGDLEFSDTAKTTLTQSPAFSVVKKVDANTIDEPGVLNYETQIENTGNVSLSNIVVTDTMPDGAVITNNGPVTDVGGVGLLDVNETWTYLTRYTVTQADINTGAALTNSVSVSSTQAGSLTDTALTTVSQEPSIGIVKISQTENFTATGDTVTYLFNVTNNGNVLLSDIEVSDLIVDAGSMSCVLPVPFSLAPAQQTSCTATWTVTDADVGGTQILNTASVSAKDPVGTLVVSESNIVAVPLLRIPPVASNNAFVSPTSSVPVTLSGAVDDYDLNGDLDPGTVNLNAYGAVDLDGDGDNDSVLMEGEGTWIVDDVTGEVTFTPYPGFFADTTPILYTVTDATGLVSNTALLSIDYPQLAPVAQNDYIKNTDIESPTNPTVVNVLVDNGSGVDSDLENNIDVASIAFVDSAAIDSDGDGDNDTLLVAEQGTWVADNGTGDVMFTPQAGFLKDPTPIFYTVSDMNDLVSNEASITVDYPQTAPIANDDEKLNQLLAKPVTVETVVNDTDPERNLDPSTVNLIDPETDEHIVSLIVLGQGVWNVDRLSGDITFTPIPGFVDNPTPVQYTVSDTTGLESNLATLTVTFVEPASLEGIVWLDNNSNSLIDENEDRKAGWTLDVHDAKDQLLGSEVTDADGYYLIEDLIPGEYTVRFFNERGVFMDEQHTDGQVLAGQSIYLTLSVKPSGVVYDSVSRLTVAGVTLNMVNASGELVHEDCLYLNQQSQVTVSDGFYAFNLIPGSHESCPNNGIYQIQIANTPSEYYPNFSAIVRQEGSAQCGDATLGCAVSATFDADATENSCTRDSRPNTNACEVQKYSSVPVDGEDTTYFVEFEYAAGDRRVIFNHLPIDALVNNAQLLLSKSADRAKVSIGSLVEYTLTAENTKDIPAVDISVIDLPPSNFGLVESSIRIIHVGNDGEFDTEDDLVQTLSPDELNPMVFSDIDFNPLETIRFKYLMRVGVGAVAGAYANKASASGPGGVASNVVSSSVSVVPDPVLEQATLVGKVFNDRDSDGSQDRADATGVVLRSDYYGWDSLSLPALPGRNSVNDDPAVRALTVNMPVSENNNFMVLTKEGTRIRVDAQGTISEAHVGDKARGFNAQDIRVCTQYVNGIPTNHSGVTPENGEPADVLQIFIQNFGINEEGIPGVRLATVTGLLIETDAYGRYSIPDMDAGTSGAGQNFVIKVDPVTVPQGSQFTTENPYVLRIINTSLNKINFGVHVPFEDPYKDGSSLACDTIAEEREHQHVEISLGAVFFDTDKHNIRADQRGIVLDMVNKLREYGGGQILIQAHTDSQGTKKYNLALAERRAQSVAHVLSESLGAELMQLISVEVDPAAYAETDK